MRLSSAKKSEKTDNWFAEKNPRHHNVAATTRITTMKGLPVKSTAVQNVAAAEEQLKNTTTVTAIAEKMYAHETRLLSMVMIDTAAMRTTLLSVEKESPRALALVALARTHQIIVAISQKAQSLVSALLS